MSRKTPEDYVKDAIIKFLKPYDQEHTSQLAWFRRNAHGGNYQTGIPDLYILIGPYHIEVECKAANGHLSPDQERWIRRFERIGTPFVVAYSYQQFLTFFQPFFDKYIKKD